MSGKEQNDAGSREEGEEKGDGEGDDFQEILDLRAKVDRMNKEADSKRLRVRRVPCRLILKSHVLHLPFQISGMQFASTFAPLLLIRISVSSFSWINTPTTRTSVAFYSFISCPILTNTIR
jgi:hypothetical protein